MAAPHLEDPYFGLADLYDLEHDAFADDREFYRRVVVAGPVLEIGAGTGRVMASLLDAGFEVWGVDASASMLARAGERLGGRPRAHLVHASVLDLDLGIRFATAIFSLNTLWHLTTLHAQVEALTTVARHLQTGGLVAIDTGNPLTLVDRGGAGEWRERFRGMRGNGLVACDFATWADEAAQTLRVQLRYDLVDRQGAVKRIESALSLRYVYAGELRLMLQRAGFGRCSVFGSYDEDEYAGDSPGLIAVAERT